MPESKKEALKRAKKKGFPSSNVVKGDESYFISPHGVTSTRGKKTYAALRSKGKDKATAAKIAHSVDKK